MIHYIICLCCLVIAHISQAQIIEAESGILSGTNVSTQRFGYAGSGYVSGFDSDGDRLTIAINTDKGVYDLYVKYAAPFGDKYNIIFVNGVNVGSQWFPEAAAFMEARIGRIHLQQGANTLAIVKDWGFIDVDYVRLASSAPANITNFDSSLVVPSSSFKADSLYELLSRLYGKAILSGQHGGALELSHIREASGKAPVIRGFDMIDYSPSRVERGTTSAETEDAIEWNKARGIVTFSWHWNAPKDLIDEPGKEWWRGFYSEATTFDLMKAMQDPSSEEYALIIRDIDAIGLQLRKLKDADVPVLWRPLHEAEGKWFWWSTKGPEPCKWLWRLLFDRLVNHHGLNNLIWIWTSTGRPDALHWYPGDEYVDIIGADIYLPAASYGSNFIAFDNIVEIYGGKKMVTLSENASIPDPESLFEEGAAWSWFCTWSGAYITDGRFNEQSHIAKVFSHEYVITLDEIDRIHEIITALEEKRIAHEHVTGITEQPDVAFENPLRDQKLTINNKGPRARIIICDLQGRALFPECFAEADELVEIDFDHLAAGMYIMSVITSRSRKVYRVVHHRNR